MKKGLIIFTAVCAIITGITLASCSNMLEDLRKAGRKNKDNRTEYTEDLLETVPDGSKKTNRVKITVDTGDKEIEKTGYVFSEPGKEKEWKNTEEVLTDSGFTGITKDSDGKYIITATRNGEYTVAVKDKDGNKKYETVKVDSIIPVNVDIPEVSIKKTGQPFDVTITGLNIDSDDFDSDAFRVVCTDSSGNEVPEVTSGAEFKINDDGSVTVTLKIPENKGEYEIAIECNTTDYGDVYLNGELKVGDYNVYTVTFDSDGGSAVAKKTVKKGEKVQKPDDPKKTAEKTSFVFLGWYNGKTAYDFSAAVNDNLNLKAKWLEGFVKVEGRAVEGGDKFTLTGKTQDYYKGVFRKGRTVGIGNFYMCDHEVTQEEYEKYCIYGGNSPSDRFGSGEDYPAYYVSWYDAVIYCNLRSEAEGLTSVYYLADEDGNEITDENDNPNGRKISVWRATLGNNDSLIKMTETDGVKKYCFAGTGNISKLDYTGDNDADGGICFDQNANGYRLPTEAEWEYAARGGKEGVNKANPDDWAGTNDKNELKEYAWYGVNSGDDNGSWSNNGRTHEVKLQKPNALNLYDMSGNVWEWCWDWYDDSVTQDDDMYTSNGVVVNPAGVVSGSYRVIRGGGWDDDADRCSVARRWSSGPCGRVYNLGFRVVRSAQ